MKRVIAATVCMLLLITIVLYQFEAVAVTQNLSPFAPGGFITPPVVITMPPITEPPFIRPGISRKPPHISTPVPETPTPVTEPPFIRPGISRKPPHISTPVPETPTPIPETPVPKTPTSKPYKPNPPESTEVSATSQNICSMGLYFREMRPKLTDEWYLFTPIELNFEGVQVYPLIASNAYEVGELKLTIENGQLLVEYQVLDGISILDEFLTFFPNIDSVKTVNVQMLEGQELPFNEPIDIASTFGEDIRVILYINNTASYNNTVPGLKHFVVENYRPWMWEIMNLLD